MTRLQPGFFRAAAVALAVTISLFMVASPALAHGGPVDVVVEGVERSGAGELKVEYGVRLAFADGDPVTDAEVRFSAGGGAAVTADETTPGVYIATLQVTTVGNWRIAMEFASADAEGAVSFTQSITGASVERPTVSVDTVDEDRVGAEVGDRSGILTAGPGGGRPASGPPLVIEAFIADAIDPLRIEYSVALDAPDFLSGVTLTAVSGDLIVGPLTLDRGGAGVYHTEVVYPAAAVWEITVVAGAEGGPLVATFGENLPWPHYTNEAGTPKVKHDPRRPDRVGLLTAPGQSIHLGDPIPALGASGVEVDIDGPGPALAQDIGLRLAHLGMLGLWIIPLLGLALGIQWPWARRAALTGLVGSIITGAALLLWGAPVEFPGILRWSELSDRLYGTAYLAAFVIKMTAAGIAVVATSRIRGDGQRAALVALGSLGGSAVAVTAMSQFHLFSHL